MGNLWYILAIVLLVIWFLGAFIFFVGKLIHLLLVGAVIVILFKAIRGERA